MEQEAGQRGSVWQDREFGRKMGRAPGRPTAGGTKSGFKAKYRDLTEELKIMESLPPFFFSFFFCEKLCTIPQWDFPGENLLESLSLLLHGVLFWENLRDDDEHYTLFCWYKG